MTVHAVGISNDRQNRHVAEQEVVNIVGANSFDAGRAILEPPIPKPSTEGIYSTPRQMTDKQFLTCCFVRWERGVFLTLLRLP